MLLNPLHPYFCSLTNDNVGLRQPSFSSLVQPLPGNTNTSRRVEIPSAADEEHVGRFEPRRLSYRITDPLDEIACNDHIILEDQSPLPVPLHHKAESLKVLHRAGLLTGTQRRSLKVFFQHFGIQVTCIIGLDKLIANREGIKLTFDIPPAIDETSNIDDQNTVEAKVSEVGGGRLSHVTGSIHNSGTPIVGAFNVVSISHNSLQPYTQRERLTAHSELPDLLPSAPPP